ncbi:chaplin [Streptomyces sp. NPDC048664]|uniref:chaplin n=1 Tax=Streptomyces sp. NPDC048664 TaxID=3154505 RepID=UPI0034406C61
MRQVTRKGLMTVAAATGVLAVTGGYAHADSGAIGSATDSPGVLSGNVVQVPVHVPVNVCGNTVNVLGLLNPSAGNACGNTGGGHTGATTGSHASGHTHHSPGVGSGNTVQVPVDVPVNACGNSVNVIGLGNGATGDHCGNGGGHGGHVVTPPGGHHHTPPHGHHHGHDCPPSHGGGGGTPPGGGTTTPPGGGTTTPPGGTTTPPGGGTTTPGTPTQPGQPTTPVRPGGGTQVVHTGAQGTVQSDSSPQLAHTGSEGLGTLLPASAGALLGGTLLYRRARASR